MPVFRKITFLIAFLGFSAFLSLSIAENFHHHGDLESHDDCAMCSWQQADSKAVATATPPILTALFVVLVLEVVSFPWRSFNFVLAIGRSPPVYSPNF
jgi:hypothetical protein